MKNKKLSRYREKFNFYLEKVHDSVNPGKKLTFYKKILKIIKKLKFLETTGKVSIKPSLINLEEILMKGKKDTIDNLNESR
jgi:hypothetical protein